MSEYQNAMPNRYPGICTRCNCQVPAGAGEAYKSAGRWSVRHTSEVACETARAATPASTAHRSGMRGELWQECERRGCDTEPVCVNCFLCERHCTCPPPPTDEEQAAEKARLLAKRDQARAAKEALLAQIDAPGFDPCSLSIQRQGHTGIFGTDWIEVTEPEHIARYLDQVLEREPRRAPHDKREPLTTRQELVRHLVATGKDMHFDDDWDANIRIRPTEEN